MTRETEGGKGLFSIDHPNSAYEPMHPDDGDAPVCDVEADDIDFEEIYWTTQPDFEAGRFLFNSADYATPEEAMVALRELIHSIVEESDRDAASNTSSDATG